MVQRTGSATPSWELYGGCVQVWDRTVCPRAIRAKNTTRAVVQGGPRLSIHERSGYNRADEGSKTGFRRQVPRDVTSSKVKGLWELPPDKCAVAGVEKERKERRGKREARWRHRNKKKRRNKKREMGKGQRRRKRKKREEGVE